MCTVSQPWPAVRRRGGVKVLPKGTSAERGDSHLLGPEAAVRVMAALALLCAHAHSQVLVFY